MEFRLASCTLRPGRAFDLAATMRVLEKNGYQLEERMKQRIRKPWHEVRHSDIHGTGVFAARKIPKGTWIIEYTGERISHEEADRRYDDDAMNEHHTFLFSLDAKECIDATRGGNDARFINHACEPNCEALWVPKEREIWICAARDIAKGEELTYDYAYEIDGETPEHALAKYPCRCGSANCRGTIVKLPEPKRLQRSA